ncbi:MAG: UDP-N-acetylmuramoyl-tripeptide--D-alanyl-D-alanine ligase [Deltaproteobacteria bacterium]|nr:MAG: UDP-N-acetylmuramoyl-tripeptide--D-alanyl-D-alanine ligase [Deltaproteobacteria bacterium]
MTAQLTPDEILEATGAAPPRRPPPARVCRGVGTDSRTLPEGALFVALHGPRFDGHDFLGQAAAAGAFGAVVARGHGHPDLACFEVEDTLRALGDLARYHRDRCGPGRVVAVTGSSGKTTTKELLAAALRKALGAGVHTEGNLNNLVGVPLTLFRLDGTEAWAVLELGMNAPGEIARLTEIVRPRVGLIVNTGPVHLEGLGTVEAVADAKAELWAGLEAGAVAVVNLDDPRLVARAKRRSDLRWLGFGRHADAAVRLEGVVNRGEAGLRVEIALAHEAGKGRLVFDLPLIGVHNAHNAAAALAAAIAVGADPAEAAQGMSEVRSVGRRMRRVAGPGGALLLDDCYNANPASTAAALEAAAQLAEDRGGTVWAALGDMLELGGASEKHHRAIGARAAHLGLAGLVGFGPGSAALVEEAERAGLHRVLHTLEPDEAAAFLREGLGPRDVVLVKGSRGMRMERIVERLAEAEGGAA